MRPLNSSQPVTMPSPALHLRLSAALVLCLAGGTATAQTDSATARRIAELEMRYANERRAHELAKLRRDNAEAELRADRETDRRNAVFLAAVMIGMTGFFFYWKRTETARLTQQWSVTDPLTGARNRRYLEQTMAADMALCARRHLRAIHKGDRAEDSDLVFLLLDIDLFKTVNDQHGHMVGDEVLKSVVRVLGEACRQSDVICRWGGAEFLVLGRITDRLLAAEDAADIRRKIEACEVQLDGRPTIRITCSVGYAAYPFRAEDAERETWMRAVGLADQGTYIPKRGGRNRSAGLIAGPRSAMTLGAPITPDAVQLWIAEHALVLEEDSARNTVVATH